MLSNVLLADSATVYSVTAYTAPDDTVPPGTRFTSPTHPEDKKPYDGRRKPRPTQSMRRAATEAKAAGSMHFCCMRCAKAAFCVYYCLCSEPLREASGLLMLECLVVRAWCGLAV